jgi:hypothetical protein
MAISTFETLPDGGHIASRVAQALPMHWATHRRACGTATTPPSTARAARRAWAAAARPVSPAAAQGLPRSSTASSCGTTRGRPHRGQRHQGSRGPRDARPTRWASWRLLTRASPHGMLRGSDGENQGLSYTRKRHTVNRRPWHPTRVPRRYGTCAACPFGRLQRRVTVP